MWLLRGSIDEMWVTQNIYGNVNLSRKGISAFLRFRKWHVFSGRWRDLVSAYLWRYGNNFYATLPHDSFSLLTKKMIPTARKKNLGPSRKLCRFTFDKISFSFMKQSNKHQSNRTEPRFTHAHATRRLVRTQDARTHASHEQKPEERIEQRIEWKLSSHHHSHS